MTASITVQNAQLVLPDRVVQGSIIVEDGIITEIGPSLNRTVGEVINGKGLTVLPGAIDPQVHFREPGAAYKEGIASGSRAAAAGGITSFLDMPNTNPPTTSVEALHHKLDTAAEQSAAHYGFFVGATGENLDELNQAERTCGIKIFMGSSTGTLLVHREEELEHIFAHANKLIAVHAEDEMRLRERKLLYESSTDPNDHPKIRDVETALMATKQAVELSLKYGQRLHILHLTSLDEAEFLASVNRERITCEVCPQHLFFAAEEAYSQIGTRVQCNPPVRTRRHAEGLYRHLIEGTINCIATDHAPHTLEEKAAGYPNTPSGMPGVEWSLPLMLDQVNQGKVSLNQVTKWMCEAPASCYQLSRKGKLETGFDGDLVLVDMAASKEITDASTRSRCGWSPFDGWTLQGWPVMTVLLGQPVFRDDQIIEGVLGRELTYDR